MNLKQLREVWDELGNTDPFWSVIAWPDKRGNVWDPRAFFVTGVNDVERLIAHTEAVRIGLSRERALDFGCGVGRLTQALALHFAEVHGVDISPSFVALAKKYNEFGSRVQYHLIETTDLQMFPSDMFDLVYTNITLQHMEPRYSRAYIREFLRVVSSDGVVVFQLPIRPPLTVKRLLARATPSPLLRAYSRLILGHPFIEMHGMNPAEVTRFVTESGGMILEVETEDPGSRAYTSKVYYIAKLRGNEVRYEPLR